jgi:acetyl-CoA carboxylase, biotin carboxylase subunit
VSRDTVIRSVLVANRGEIAVRIMRACRELNIRSIAVYSDADRTAPHVLMADEAHRIGPPEASRSYLNGTRILEAAKASGAEAVHPGYGFLAENAAFARLVEDSGLIFIGPSSGAIGAMGDKVTARKYMKNAGVPVIPGSDDPVGSVENAAIEAEKIGFPVILKAVGGGGGKGMRIVEESGEIRSSFIAAQNEAQAAFGDNRIFIEKYLVSPKHIEVQVIADSQGDCVHLGERECSVQRRHQKIVEEAPSPGLQPEVRMAMAAAAVNAARACDYRNAGTVEFLVDAHGSFYFLEMNTRIQVEHPVTEDVTGMDIVKEQISIASGRSLSITQGDVAIRGHAVECRIYAEDGDNDFLPSTGTIRRMISPGGPGIRIDSGYREGDAVTIHYDPLISKVISWGRTRNEALMRMIRALNEYTIQGVRTNINACLDILRHPSFVEGTYTTRLIAELYSTTDEKSYNEFEAAAAAVAAAISAHENKKRTVRQADTGYAGSRWKMLNRYRGRL